MEAPTQRYGPPGPAGDGKANFKPDTEAPGPARARTSVPVIVPVGQVLLLVMARGGVSVAERAGCVEDGSS